MSLKYAVKSHMLQTLRSIQPTARDGTSVYKPIAELNTYENSVNIYIGPQGKRKTSAALIESIALTIKPEVHLIVVIMKKAYDPTVEAAKNVLIESGTAQLVTIDYETAIDYIKQLVKMKAVYNEFIRKAHSLGVTRDDIPNHVENLQVLYDTLYVTDFSRDWLQTMIIAEDSGDDKFLKNPFINNCLKLCREQNITWHLTIHGFDQITPNIKQNAAVVSICKGLSDERLNIIYHRTNHGGMDRKQFLRMYNMMNQNDNANYLVIDNINATVHIE
jgi:hypothetical protein